jgi:uncharacterized protein with FMN-binding domain
MPAATPAATSRTSRAHRLAAVGGGLLSLAALAGCAPSASSASGAATSDPASVPSPAASSTSRPTAAAAGLKDGTYSATGDYQSPGGASSVAVTVTLKSGAITAVQVKPAADNPTARQYESQFASGIDAVAVGKPIEGLQVGAVSGSSLTSQGFEKALAAIRSKAAA